MNKEHQPSFKIGMNGMSIQPTYDAMSIEHSTSGARLLITFKIDNIVIKVSK